MSITSHKGRYKLSFSGRPLVSLSMHLTASIMAVVVFGRQRPITWHQCRTVTITYMYMYM